MKSSSTSSHRCRRSNKSSVQPPSQLQVCAPLCQRLSSPRSQVPRTRERARLPLVIFKIRSDVTHKTPSVQRKLHPAGARMESSFYSRSAQVVLIHVLKWCQTKRAIISHRAHLLHETTQNCQSRPTIGVLFTIKDNAESTTHKIWFCFTLARSSKAFSAYFFERVGLRFH